MDAKHFYGKNTVVPPEYDSEGSIVETSDDEDDIDHEATTKTIGEDSSEDEQLLEENEDELEEIPAATASKNKIKKRPLLWKVPLDDDILSIHDFLLHDKAGPVFMSSPRDYFDHFFRRELLVHIVEQTNIYAVQKNVMKPLLMDIEELEQFLGIVMYMSIIKLPCSRDYWSMSLRIPQVCDVMSVHRFEAIRSVLHFNNNDYQILPGLEGYDRIYKIRPIFDSILEVCQKLSKPEKLCVDEQVVPFKGKSSLRQYNPQKPKQWGFKMFVMADKYGMVHNFQLYTGKIEPCDGFLDVGASGNIVFHMVSILPHHANYKLYFDNWFCGLPLQVELAKLGIWCLGTVRQNRLPGIKLSKDADMKKKGRGTTEERKTTVDDVELVVTKWYDNRGVTLLSTFVGKHPTDIIMKRDMSQKSKVKDKEKPRNPVPKVPINRPKCIAYYNENMGGVDSCDQFLASARCTLKSPKWYMRLFFHMVDLSCVNAWCMYRKDCKTLEFRKNDIQKLKHFKTSIAESLVQLGKDVSKKRGRPSSSSSTPEQFIPPKLPRRVQAAKDPLFEVQKDGLYHWPKPVKNRGKCRNKNCESSNRMQCSKCKVNLCLTNSKNCFLEYHQ